MADPLENIPIEKQDEARALDAIYRSMTGWKPTLWRNMIDYGRYSYRTTSGQESAFVATGFDMRAQGIASNFLPRCADTPKIARLEPS